MAAAPAQGRFFIVPQYVQQHVEYWTKPANLIVHRRTDIRPQWNLAYTHDMRDDTRGRAPFPLGLDAIWYCGALLVLILAIHAEAHGGWLRDLGYLAYYGRVLGRVVLTLLLSVGSTAVYEVVGNVGSNLFAEWRDRQTAQILVRLDVAQVDEDGNAIRDEENSILWRRDLPWYDPNLCAARLSLAVMAFCNYICLIAPRELLSLAALYGLPFAGSVFSFLFGIPASFFSDLPSLFTLPRPDLDAILAPRDLWLEYGVPVCIQLGMVVFLWLLYIRYQAKAEELPMIHGIPLVDPKSVLFGALINATALHLLAYSSYQLTCACRIALGAVTREKWAQLIGFIPRVLLWVAEPVVDELKDHVWILSRLGRVLFPHGVRLSRDTGILSFVDKYWRDTDLFAGGFIYCFDMALTYLCWRIVGLLRWPWAPYLFWSTVFSREGIDSRWRYWTRGPFKIILVFQHDRFIGRALMTAVFGLGSAWTVRSRLTLLPDGRGQLGEWN